MPGLRVDPLVSAPAQRAGAASPSFPNTSPHATMKTRFASFILVGSLALIAGLAVPRASSDEINNNSNVITPVPAPADPAPVVVTPTVERYLVIDTSRVPVGGPQRAAATLESILNEHAAQGWRLKETMPPFIILVQ
jgi:hypothetical protein